MFSCKVLVGPIATDKEYHAGDTVCLSEQDANVLSGFGIIQIIIKVDPTSDAVVETPIVAEVAPAIEPIVTEPVAVSEPVVEAPATEVAPDDWNAEEDLKPLNLVKTPAVAEAAPAIEPVATESVAVSEPVLEAPMTEVASVDEAAIEPVAVSEPVVETPVVAEVAPAIEPIVTEPVVETPVVDEVAPAIEPITEPVTVSEPVVETPVVDEVASVDEAAIELESVPAAASTKRKK